MVLYSHSKLSTFEQCPYKYKLKYIDKIKKDEKEFIELFLGKRVHDTLEKLYCDLKHQKETSMDDLLLFFDELWDERWHDGIIIKKQYEKENYKEMGRKFITDYYNRHYPFDEATTLGLEQRILIQLDEEGTYKLQGYIDRIAKKGDGEYEIHDYKTSGTFPVGDVSEDRQLALYAIGVKNQYPDVSSIKLFLHYLAFDMELCFEKKEKELEDLKKATIELIETIEHEEQFDTNVSALCDWCDYQTICKDWAHLFKIKKEEPENKYLKDSGVELVDTFDELQKKKREITYEIDKIEKALLNFCEKEKIEVVFGTDKKVKVKKYFSYSLPPKNSDERLALEQFIKDAGKWGDVEQLDYHELNLILKKRMWDDELSEEVKKRISVKESVRFFLSMYA